MAERKKGVRRGKTRSENSNWKKSPVTGGIAGLLILFCLYSLFSTSSPKSSFRMDFICLNSSCSLDERLDRPKNEAMPPYTCPKCQQKEMHQAQLCTNPECGKHTAVLPAKILLSCLECKYKGEHRLDPFKGPHPCPGCKKQTLADTYECSECKHQFPYQVKMFNPNEEMSEDMAIGFGFMDGFTAVPCPKCNKEKAMTANQERIPSCLHCESVKLKPITPPAVIKWEMGRFLSKKEEKIIEEWKAKQGQ